MHAETPAELDELRGGVVLTENRDDLCLAEAGLPHDRAPFGISAGKPMG